MPQINQPQASATALTGITLAGRLRQTRRLPLFIGLVLLAPALVALGASHLFRLWPAGDLGITTGVALRQDRLISSVDARWRQVQNGDEVIAINGISTPGFERFWAARLSARPGPVTVTVQRGAEAITETALNEEISFGARFAMALRVIAGALLLLIGIASFLLKPGTRVSWLHFFFVYLLGVLIVAMSSTAAKPSWWIFIVSIPQLIFVATCGIYFFR